MSVETVGYAKRAIKLLNEGKVTKADPFKSIGVATGFLNLLDGDLQALGALIAAQPVLIDG